MEIKLWNLLQDAVEARAHLHPGRVTWELCQGWQLDLTACPGSASPHGTGSQAWRGKGSPKSDLHFLFPSLSISGKVRELLVLGKCTGLTVLEKEHRVTSTIVLTLSGHFLTFV